MSEVTSKGAVPWRVGKKVGRTVYDANNLLIGVMDTPGLATRVIAGVNALPVVPYNRSVLIDVLVYHWRTDVSGCGCGWAELGRSHAEHVATVFEESVSARTSDQEGP